MKITTISKVASLVISFVTIQTAVAGHAAGIGVGPHFGGGGFGGGIFEMFVGGGSARGRLHRAGHSLRELHTAASYLERGSEHHLGGRTAKSSARAIATALANR